MAMVVPSNARSKALSIDAALLERMGVLARRHPGHTVSLARDRALSPILREKVVLHVDGEAALEFDAGPPTEPTHAA
jgi:hypothetical protein